MSATIKYQPVRFGGYKDIQWLDPLSDLPNPSVPLLATPVATWLSTGFSALTLGVSLYNAFQLHKQQEILETIDLKLDEMNYKLNTIERKLDAINYSINLLHYKTDLIIMITKSIKTDTQQIKDIQKINFQFLDAINHFEKRLSNRQISFDLIKKVEGDIENTFLSLWNTYKPARNKKTNDIPLPNWVIDKNTEIFSFFQLFNLFLIESHNFLSKYNPLKIKNYISITDDKIIERVNPKESKKEQLTLPQLFEYYNKTNCDLQPRLDWLMRLLWEVKQISYTIETSQLISRSDQTLYLPVFDEVIEKIR
ncbi:MAG: hypothetical protein DAHOPDDO_00568 [Ignavibacteriaceae bacterium]|jgi:hypothetical protein|nr:hypothetical protein [Ignavibacteriaceae bacterium]